MNDPRRHVSNAKWAQLGTAELAAGRARRAEPRSRPHPGDDRDGAAAAPSAPRRPARPATRSAARPTIHPRDDADPHLSRARTPCGRLDPLGLASADLPADLTPAFHGFTGAVLDRPIFLGGRSASSRRPCASSSRSCRQLLRPRRPRIHAHHDVEERRFLQERMEGQEAEIQLHPRGQAVDPRPRSSTPSSGRNSSPANMSAPSASGSTAAKAWSRRSRR